MTVTFVGYDWSVVITVTLELRQSQLLSELGNVLTLCAFITVMIFAFVEWEFRTKLITSKTLPTLELVFLAIDAAVAAASSQGHV